MSTIDPNKKIQKAHTEQEMRMALNDFISQKYALHIPPQVGDADMVLSDAITELIEAREKLASSGEMAAMAWGMANANNACISDLQRQVSLLHEEVFCTHANRPATRNQTLLGDVRELRRMVFSLQTEEAKESQP